MQCIQSFNYAMQRNERMHPRFHAFRVSVHQSGRRHHIHHASFIVEVIILGLAPRSDARAAHVWCPKIALVHVLEGALAEGARSTEVCCCPWSVLDSGPNRGSEPGPTESPGSSDPRGPVCLPVPGSCGGGRAYYMPCTIQITNIQQSQPVPRLFNNT